MSKKHQNIENLYRSQFEGFTAEPSKGLWNKIQYKLWLKQFFSFSLNAFNIYYTAAIIAIPVTGVLLLTNPQKSDDITGGESTEQINTSELQTGQEAVSKKTTDRTGRQPVDLQTRESELSGVTPEESSKTGDQATEKLRVTPESKTTGSENKTTVKNVQKESTAKSEDQDKRLKSESRGVVISFNASKESGCAPLAVNFINRTENAESYTWNFGDGGSSSEEHPSYIFDEPGEYSVTLKAIGANGTEYTVRKTITVFEKPKAQFEFDEDVSLSKGEPVWFYNYSRKADFYEWDFGDNSKSNLVEPVHYYSGPGSYNIKLKVWTENQCYDSLIVYNAFSDQDNYIVFPTAFTPNPTGPTGGYYMEDGTRNEVFYPVVNGNLIEYNLKIFNRLGIQIFESNDVNIGWDGYYHEQLLPQDVYIWKVRGKFENGKTFVQSGDITLIRQR